MWETRFFRLGYSSSLRPLSAFLLDVNGEVGEM